MNKTRSVENPVLFHIGSEQNDLAVVPASTFIFEAQVVNPEFFEIADEEFLKVQEQTVSFWADSAEGDYSISDGKEVQ